MKPIIFLLLAASLQAATITYSSADSAILAGTTGAVEITDTSGAIVPMWTAEFTAGSLDDCDHPGTAENYCRYLFRSTFTVNGQDAGASIFINEIVQGDTHYLDYNLGTTIVNPTLLFVFDDPVVASRVELVTLRELGAYQTGQIVSFEVPLVISPAFVTPEPSFAVLTCAALAVICLGKRRRRG